MRRRIALVVAIVAGSWAVVGQGPSPPTALPAQPDSVKFAVIGDNGDGSSGEYDVGRRMAEARATFPFEFVLMLGDNMYGSQKPKDFVDKFERPFAAILQAGVPIAA
jgi:hypothetical protein